MSRSFGRFNLAPSVGLHTANSSSLHSRVTCKPGQWPSPWRTATDILARKIDVMHDRGNPQVDCGVGLGKPAEPVHQPFGGKIGQGAHGQHARALPLHQALDPHGDAIERIAHDGKVVAAGIGDDQPLPLAVEQLDAELGFQRFNLMTHSALRDAKLLGGAGEADMPGRGLEGFECVQLWQAPRHGARISRRRSLEKLNQTSRLAGLSQAEE